MNRNITAVILIVLAVGIYLTWTSPMWDQVNAIRSVSQEYATAVTNADELLRTRDKVEIDFNALSAVDKDRLTKMLPGNVDTIRLIIDLNSVAARRGLALQGIQAKMSSSATPPNQTTTASGTTGAVAPAIDTITVAFSLSAPYQQFIDFLHDLESDLRIMDITHLTVTSDDSGVYSYNVELKTYWLHQ